MYRGYFINLDRNHARRTAMESQIAERGLADRYTRFPAADVVRLAQHHSTRLEPGNLGCWFSHTAILADNIGADSHLHIMEDDTVLCRDAKQAFPALLRCASEMSPPWDLIFTDIFTPFDLELFRRFAPHVGEPESRNRGMLFDLKDITFAGTSSYFVNARSIEKYHRLMEGNWTSDLPIDLYVRRLVQTGQLNAHVTVPFLTAPSGHSSGKI